MRFVRLVAMMVLGASMVGSSVAMAEALPVPPIPPAQPPLGEVAPVPDVDARGPIPLASDSPTVDVKFFHPKLYDPGLGYAPGSQYQINEDRRPIQPPGLSISVPLR